MAAIPVVLMWLALDPARTVGPSEEITHGSADAREGAASPPEMLRP